ncbi:NUDIX hydrolase [Phenylobacterium soli]|uniref:NUDIX hydrolase n=1 Tax=Phenylobacterium soli TaxID=2170551 RepID=A0A328AMV0_9CAUL|nr:NUDIX domain-containing protein [Phenylobacterium soli]RAK56313.1 NUDIX hydrolase [Phenylobacterium soli]
MSEKPPAEIKPAATILLLRDAPSFEVLMVKRHHQIDFASGALVFPGGKSHAGDHDPSWAEHVLGWEAFDAEQRGLRIAAIREVFEEAGILLAKRRSGEAIGGEACPMDVRQAVDAGTTSFLEVVRDLDAQLDLSALTVFARWITPVVVPKRFDTWFYVVRAPDDQLAACDGRETVDAEWIAPGEALRLAAAGERKVIFPTRMNLQLLAEASHAGDAVARAEARTLVTVEPQVQRRPEGPVLVLPPDAGYGAVEERLESAM